MPNSNHNPGIESIGVPNTELANRIRSRIFRSLKKQGFELREGRLAPPDIRDKSQLRRLHQEAVIHNRARSRAGLERHEERLLSRVASGREVVPADVKPVLVEVEPRSNEELLFRYARLHWSIPVSAGYGRRLRFVVYDEANGKLIGIIGMGDPVFGLGPRDRWIGWDVAARKNRLKCVMDLFVLGAVPPYSQLLCGKLMALLATSTEVQEAFRSKYGGRKAYISGRTFDGRLALLTTTSALGRSSLYNRLRYRGRTVFESVGFTSGSGDFHFSNGFYGDLRELAVQHCEATAKHPSWGGGFRNRRELVRKTLPLLGLSTRLQYHGVQREVFAVPLAENARAFLRGEESELEYYGWRADDLFAWFRKRWLLPRADRDQRYREFERESYRLWGTR
ncbi:MAG: DUF4338 domain-containing protein [Gemmatimonadota bacterium]|nr:DUF4338 domain-containing protein [Gemmatimonadota bacterium]